MGEPMRQVAAAARGSDCPPKTEICLTIDAEFSIGGAFANPSRYRPLSNETVNCVVNGQEEGLGFLLRVLRAHGVHATFFVEALQTFYFGENPMRSIVERIALEGHDIQLHLHPCWLHFRSRNWRTMTAPNDSCAGRDPSDVESLLQYGVDVFARWGIPRPTSLRTGGFHCDRNVYRAMRRCGLPLASNVALAMYRPSEPDLHFTSGRHFIEGVMELPVLGYSTTLPLTKARLRNAAITATSWREMEALLWAARENEISPVVVLTHPFEFVKRDDFRFRAMRRNAVNQRRLEKLLAFISRNSQSFVAATFASHGEEWLTAGAAPSKLLHSPRSLSLMRAAQNFINDRI